jgi:enterochelin esterase-like enzyme
MKYFNGFCLQNEKELFKEFLEENEFCVAGFSFGAQKALEYALNSSVRVDKLQLISPAFFDYPQKIIDLNINAFKKDRNSYVRNFLKKAGCNVSDGDISIDKTKLRLRECSESELYEMFTFNWEKIKNLHNIEIEIFLGEFDKIIALKKAHNFFVNYADVYLIKKANHFLRS